MTTTTRTTTTTKTAPSRALSPTPTPTPSQVPLPASPSPYPYASTTAGLSTYSLPPLPPPPPPPPAHAILTKADLEQSQAAYAELLATAKAYRVALSALSTAASAFGSALESCARLKEARAAPLVCTASAPTPTQTQTHHDGACTADLLLSASGVHHLIANHELILSETVYRSFEVPLLHELDKWRGAVADEGEAYARAVAAQSRDIRRLEKEGAAQLRQEGRRRRQQQPPGRDVARFRGHLVELTAKLDGLTALHGAHAGALLRESQEASCAVRDASCSLVRAEVDIFEALARKGWSGGGLDELLEKGQDLFAEQDDEDDGVVGPGPMANGTGGGAGGGGEGAKLFSILPPRSILADASSDRGRPEGGRADSLLVAEGGGYQSLTGAVADPAGGDADSIFSDFNQGRGVRPFSPQPIRRRHTDVVMDPEELLSGSDDAEADDEERDYEEAKAVAASDRGRERGRVREGIDDDGSPWKDEGLEPTRQAEREEDSSNSSPGHHIDKTPTPA